MSNGVPSAEEGGEPRAPGPYVLIALVYACIWILGALAALLFDLTSVKDRKWLVWASVAVLAVAIAVLAKELHRLGPARGKPAR